MTFETAAPEILEVREQVSARFPSLSTTPAAANKQLILLDALSDVGDISDFHSSTLYPPALNEIMAKMARSKER